MTMTTLREREEVSEIKEVKTHRILVVDDESSISDLISTSLRFVGFDVRTAANGAQALQVAEEFQPHAIVLDVMLPDLDGFEVCRQLRSEGHNVGVLFLTAKDGMEDKVAGLTIGGDDYMTKPFSLEELVARIRALLRRTGAIESLPDDQTIRFADLELDERGNSLNFPLLSFSSFDTFLSTPTESSQNLKFSTMFGSMTSAETRALLKHISPTFERRSTFSSRH
jgi:two-component system OmpR family response regulator